MQKTNALIGRIVGEKPLESVDGSSPIIIMPYGDNLEKIRIEDIEKEEEICQLAQEVAKSRDRAKHEKLKEKGYTLLLIKPEFITGVNTGTGTETKLKARDIITQITSELKIYINL